MEIILIIIGIILLVIFIGASIIKLVFFLSFKKQIEKMQEFTIDQIKESDIRAEEQRRKMEEFRKRNFPFQ